MRSITITATSCADCKLNHNYNCSVTCKSVSEQAWFNLFHKDCPMTEQKCEWKNTYGIVETSCGATFAIDEESSAPKYCHECGKQVVEMTEQ